MTSICSSRRIVFTIVICLLTALSSPSFAQTTQPARVLVSGHPRLFFTSSELNRLRELRTDGLHAKMWANIRASADWCLTQPVRTKWIAPVTPDPIYENLYDRFFAMMHDMAVTEYLSFAYAYSGDQKYFDGGRDWALALCHVWIHEADGTPDASKAYAVTRLLKGIAISYDLLYDRLSEKDRAEMRDTLLRVGGKYYDFFKNPASGFGPGYEPHHGTMETCSMGLVALSLLGEAPEVSNWLDLMVRKETDWLLPYIPGAAFVPSGTHNQTTNFWISVMQYRIAFFDALRRVTGRDLFTEYEKQMPYTVPLACAVGKGAEVGEYPQDDQSWLWGPSYGQIDYASPVLMYLARQYRRPILQHLALWDPAPGVIAKSRYITPHGEWMLFDWGAYAYAWYDSTVPDKIEPNLPRSFIFEDPDKNPILYDNEAYARASYELGGIAVGIKHGAVIAHAGGRPVFVDFIPAWPPKDPVKNLTLHDDGNIATITCTGVADTGYKQQTITLKRSSPLTIERSTDQDLRWWCYGPVQRDADTLTWPDGTTLHVRKGHITSFDPQGYRPEMVTGLGKLKLPDPAPRKYPQVTAKPDNGELIIEVDRK
jgi:hypothetical protein